MRGFFRLAWLFGAALFLFLAPPDAALAKTLINPARLEPAAAPPDDKRLNFIVSIDESTLVDRLIYNALLRAGYGMTMDAAPMAYAVQMANDGERDGLASQSKGIEARFPDLVIVPEQLASVSFPVFARVDSDLKINSWDDFSGLRVGHLFKKLHIINQLPKDIAAAVMRESFRELMDALQNGECDVAVTSSTNNIPLVLPENVKRVGTAQTMPSYTFVHKRHAGLVPGIVAALRSMKLDGSYAKIIKGMPLDAGARRQVLHISSLNPDDAWESRLKAGMTPVFATDESIAYYNVPLYSNRFQTDSERARNVYYTIRTLFSSNPPDLVVASGNNALAFVCAYYGIMFNNIPIVFCDVNTPAGELWELGDHAVGVWQSIPAAETVAQILRMYPQTGTLLVINDYTETGMAWRRETEPQLASYAGKTRILYNADQSNADLLETVSALPAHSAVLLGNYNVDSAGMAFSRQEMQRAIVERSAAPVFGMLDAPGNGQVGGRYIDPEAQGRLAAEMALAILKGARLADIAPLRDTSKFNRWIFDAAVLESLSLGESALPAGAEFINRKLGLAESNPEAFHVFVALTAAALAIIACLIVFAVLMRRKNRRLMDTQRSLHTAEELLAKDAEIIEAKERLDIALDSSQAGVWEISLTDGTFSFDGNSAELFGINEPSPMPVEHLISLLRRRMPDYADHTYFRRILANGILAESVLQECKLVFENGRERHLSNFAKTIYGQDDIPLKTIGMSMDVSQRVQMSEELREAKELADAANQAQSRFLSNMSHEIRTPLNAVLGMIKIAEDSGDPDRIKDCLAKAEDSSRHLLDIINNILDISKIESGRLELFDEPFDLAQVVQSAVNVVNVKAAEKTQDIVVLFDPELPTRVKGDSVRLTQVFLNLLSNAVKFSGTGTKILVGLKLAARGASGIVLAVTVRDEGIGLAPDQLQSIFESFRQADGSIAKRFGGTGLGLAITKKIINMMGGEISVTSSQGRGSEFSFQVRLELLDDADDADDPATARLGQELSLLVIDGDADSRANLAALLKARRIRCRTAGGYWEAVALLAECAASEKPINLALIDNGLPGMGGLEAARRLRAQDSPGLKIALMSSQQTEELWEDAKRIGVNLFLTKPVFPAALRKVLSDAASNGSSAAPPAAPAAPDCQGRHILIVEDMEINREIARAILEPCRADISEAADGREAVELFNASPDKFDLVLMDIQMPVMDGYAATRAIRQSGHPKGASIPIIAMTANAFREDVEAALNARMNGHISKPVDAAKIYEELQKHLG